MTSERELKPRGVVVEIALAPPVSITYLTTCSNKNISRPRSNFPELITTSFCWRVTSGPKVNYDIK